MYFPQWFLLIIIILSIIMVGASVPFLLIMLIKEIKNGTAW